MKKLSIFLTLSLLVASLSGFTQGKSGDVKSGSASKTTVGRVSSSNSSTSKMNARTGTSARSNSGAKMRVGDSNTAHRPHRNDDYTKPNHTITAPVVPQPVVQEGVSNSGHGIVSIADNNCRNRFSFLNPYAMLLPTNCQWILPYWNNQFFYDPINRVEDLSYNEELILMNTSNEVLTVEVEFTTDKYLTKTHVVVLQPGESYKLSQRYVYPSNEVQQTAIGRLRYDRYNVRVYVGSEVKDQPDQSASGVCVDQNIYLSLTPNGVN